MDAKSQEVEQPIDELWPATALSACQGVGTQQQHGARRVAAMRRSNADRVAHQQVFLQSCSVLVTDPAGGQGAETGRHAVDHLVRRDQLVDNPPAGRHPFARRLVQSDVDASAGNVLDLLKGQVVAVEIDHSHVAPVMP